MYHILDPEDELSSEEDIPDLLYILDDNDDPEDYLLCELVRIMDTGVLYEAKNIEDAL